MANIINKWNSFMDQFSWGIFWSSIFVVLGVATSLLGICSAIQFNTVQKDNWTLVEFTVTKVTITSSQIREDKKPKQYKYSYNVIEEYEVDGMTYSYKHDETYETILSTEDEDDFDYREGMKLDRYVNPKDPQDVFGQAGDTIGGYVFFAVFGIIVTVISVVIQRIFVHMKRKKKVN